ncbi:hypothetical protein KP509_15G005700 [Ceratopteris richardii]|uniref:Uncharacterized protein n=1 Tax=Ceratopteris richardii TaxID=49495 RepID=A0A8T2T2E3_CERRI|nr:hypothetical protein KP509_15G005700 [Ceratopteris richardii]
MYDFQRLELYILSPISGAALDNQVIMEAKSFISEIVYALELAMLVGLFMSASSMESVAKAMQSIPNRNLDGVTNTELMQTAEGLSLFVDKLPFIRTINGYTISPKGTRLPANLTIGMHLKYWKFHRDLPASRVFAFGESASSATIPGPTIIAMSGVKTYILWENFLPNEHIFTVDNTLETAKPNAGVPTVVHLHGGVTEPESDGSALAWFTNGFRERGERWRKAVYLYHNAAETGTMWYHDHALGYTRLNLLAGLIGAYKIVNPRLENEFRLPQGEFDQMLVVMDRSFTKDGQIYINSTGIRPEIHPQWQPEYYGNVIVVNGKAWPYMEVQRRKYRFRIINASNARYFNF